jgi:hypothetical protein
MAGDIERNLPISSKLRAADQYQKESAAFIHNSIAALQRPTFQQTKPRIPFADTPSAGDVLPLFPNRTPFCPACNGDDCNPGEYIFRYNLLAKRHRSRGKHHRAPPLETDNRAMVAAAEVDDLAAHRPPDIFDIAQHFFAKSLQRSPTPG